jgi:A/G-specific adenine glycosylase
LLYQFSLNSNKEQPPAFKERNPMKTDFTRKLLKWNTSSNNRSMPWKKEKDPYKIWLSEIILQQTRVEQGLDYYNKYIKAFPTIHHLAKAPERKVFKLWEGLGYYRRCKNLISTAKLISKDLDGNFPDTYENIKSLKGIGPYTASAIASFAYNLPHAVVDGNVSRILSRYFGISTPVDSTEGKKIYNLLAESLLYRKEPGIYNQAIMDFGALICKPKSPLCNECVQNKECEAFQHNWVKELPVKKKAVLNKTRWFNYFVVEYKGQVYVRKRTTKDIWSDLFEFILKETDQPIELDPSSLSKNAEQILGTTRLIINDISKEYRQKLTHQTIIGRFISISLSESSTLPDEYKLVQKSELKVFPFPAFINLFLNES